MSGRKPRCIQNAIKNAHFLGPVYTEDAKAVLSGPPFPRVYGSGNKGHRQSEASKRKISESQKLRYARARI